MSKKIDEVAVRCPHCGSLAAGRVSHIERLAGNAELTCLVCKRTVKVPPPQPLGREFLGTMRLYGVALKKMGWIQVVSLATVWIGGGYLLTTVIGWPSWLAMAVPAIPFIYFFARAFAPLMQAQIKGELGVLRLPKDMRGLSERDPLAIRQPGDEDRLIAARKCPQCGGVLKPGERKLVLPKSNLEALRLRYLKRATRLFEQVDVTCQKCDFHGAFFFDISALEIVRKLGYTQALINIYPPQHRRKPK